MRHSTTANASIAHDEVAARVSVCEPRTEAPCTMPRVTRGGGQRPGRGALLLAHALVAAAALHALPSRLPAVDAFSYTGNVGSSISFSLPPYDDNQEEIRWTVTGPAGALLGLTFTSFNTEGCCDPTSVWDGEPPHAAFTTYYGRGPTSMFMSTGNTLTVTFSSDSSVTGSGWDAVVVVFGGDNTEPGGSCGVYAPGSAPPEGAVRLAGGMAMTTGRLEYYHDGAWGTVCDDHFSNSGVEVVCRQLGCGGVTGEEYDALGGDDLWIVLDDVACVGDETALGQCPARAFGVHNCARSENVAIRCLDCDVCGPSWPAGFDPTFVSPESGASPRPPMCGQDVYPGAARLAGGAGNAGVLEVFDDDSDTWGTVCGRNAFDMSTAGNVVCRQLGCEGGVAERMEPAFVSTAPIALDGVWCDGTEPSLAQCDVQRDVPTCGHGEDPCYLSIVQNRAVLCCAVLRRLCARSVAWCCAHIAWVAHASM